MGRQTSLPLSSEIVSEAAPDQHSVHSPFPFVIISTYRDNIYLCMANVRAEAKGTLAHALFVLQHTIYGINLKWEPHGDRYVRGEGSIGVQGAKLSLVRKGAFVGERPLEEGEWEKWVDTSSPHAPMVWKSHSPSLLVKCVWYASDKECLRANLRCVRWGLGAKEYPVTWWRGAL